MDFSYCFTASSLEKVLFFVLGIYFCIRLPSFLSSRVYLEILKA